MANSSSLSSPKNILVTKAPQYSKIIVKEYVKKLYGLTGVLSFLDSERDQNFLFSTITGDQYVIKISNSSVNPDILEMQVYALKHIAKVNPDIPVPRVLSSLNGQSIQQIQSSDGIDHFVHILTYLPGMYPKDKQADYELLHQVGKTLADLVLALRGFTHPSASYDLLWDLKQASKLDQYLSYVYDPDQKKLAVYFLTRFKQVVLPEIPKLRAQVVHNDFAPNNMLVSENNPGEIVGIIDFGDMIHSLLVTDLATTIAQFLVEEGNPVEIAGEIIASYHQVIPLEREELVLLYDLIATRLTMLNVIASWRVTLHPENKDYIMGGVDQVWTTLEVWKNLDPDDVTRQFLRSCGFWELDSVNLTPTEQKVSLESHLSRRAQLLGPCSYLFYERPIHVIRGNGVWLYDEQGNRFLDAYNNVPHVGHCHPHVIKEINDQARKLNTSTRYMHDLVLELAEQITIRMPGELRVCMFVCTGSEANELAWRMSKLVSGNTGAVITNFSYHGNGDATTRFSTSDVPKETLPPHVETIHAPISNTAFLEPDSGINKSIRSLSERGHRPAMLILDTGFVTDGVFTSPPGYLKMLANNSREAGGLFVADEVQAGFGRLGEKFWGFEWDSVVPDIVTLGKPMGNGHPIAAVVTRPEIAEALAADTGYFNTFGGNPVSCAAGLAVLNVIEKEGLQQNAFEVGRFIRNRLVELRNGFPSLGPPHGSGLLLGVDLLKADGSPDSRFAGFIMNHMRENGVLVGLTGPYDNILKIRPPIVFNKEHAEILLAALSRALVEC